jgi:hypothetical protein
LNTKVIKYAENKQPFLKIADFSAVFFIKVNALLEFSVLKNSIKFKFIFYNSICFAQD